MGYKLYSSLTSPYGRKVRMALCHLGLEDNVQVIHADTLDPDDELRRVNPLGKIPALVPAGGPAIYDSKVIIDYLDGRYGRGEIVPCGYAKRARTMTLATLADGLTDALLLITYEARFRGTDTYGERWLSHQYGKLDRGFAEVLSVLKEFSTPSLPALALSCALGYADWRKQIDWRSQHPELVNWLDSFRDQFPEFDKTEAP
ncbi:MAG: glutathione S-transferase [Alphaproteobacteria bacterium]|nr:glutathione S-transferase [Alphaproteobacteria bacterium]